jgi:hypothetical protein
MIDFTDWSNRTSLTTIVQAYSIGKSDDRIILQRLTQRVVAAGRQFTLGYEATVRVHLM